MRRNETLRIVAIMIVLIVAAYFFYPTARLWLMSPEEQKQMANTDPIGLENLEQSAIKLGLDLQGGMHIVLKVDVTNMSEAETVNARDRALEIIRNRVDKFGISEPQIMPQGDDYIVVELPGMQDVERAQELIGKTAQLEFRFLETPENTRQLVEKIDKILGENPLEGSGGEKPADTAEAAEMEAKAEELFADDDTAEDTAMAAAEEEDALIDTADTSDLLADFDDEPTHTEFSGYLQQESQESFIVFAEDVSLLRRYLALDRVQAIIPHDVEWMWSTREQPWQGRSVRRLHLVKDKIQMTGDCLTAATPGYDEMRSPQVNFRLTKDCGSQFARITGPNIGKPLAIILDGQVESAPRIQDRIRDQGVINLSPGATFEDARDLAIVLQAGALPAPVNIMENNVVGPSLGKDSVRSGLTASLVGLCIVIIIMAFYYRLSGLVADFAIVFNLFVLLSIMSMLQATLTVPGIAGIILLVGISVDAAVLIFERIREELLTGKTVRASIDAGYDRAAVAIIDSNITTLIVASILYAFGTGPVKGFAITLSIGILVSLFSALVVTRTIFEFRKSYKSLSI